MPELLTSLQHRPLTADPTSPNDGAEWYRSDTDELRIRIGSTTYIVGPAHHQDTWQYKGTLATYTDTFRWCPKRAGQILRVWLTLGTAGSTTTTCDLNKSGATLFSGTKPNLTSGQNLSSEFVPASPLFTATDYLSLDIDAIGTGAADLLAFVEWIETA